MDLFTTLRNRNKPLIERTRLGLQGEAGINRMSDLSHEKVLKTGAMLYNTKRRMVIQTCRVFGRNRWLSLQYFSLASIINLYLAILEAQNEKTRCNRIQKFTNSCSTILKRYKKPVYKKYKKALGRKKRQEPSLSDIEKAAVVVYGELKTINKLYQRRRAWRHIVQRVRSLLRGDVRQYQ
jgi:hypothetical protein